MKVEKQRKIGAILSYVAIIANTVVQLVYTPFLVFKLGQSEYGLYSLVASIIGYLTVLDLGFGNAIIVHTAKYRVTGETDKEKTLHGMFKIIYFVIGIVAAIVGVVMASNAGVFFGESMSSEDIHKMKIMLLILSLNLFLTFAFSIYNSIITASESFVFQKGLTIVGTIAKPLLMIPILFMGFKSIALCIVITVVNVAILMANYVYCKKRLKVSVKFRGFDTKLLKVVFGYSFWIFLTQIVDQVNWQADQFILGAVSGTIAVSIYAAAAQINLMFVNLSTAISNVMLPKMTKMVAQKATSKELTDEMIKAGRIQFIVVFLVMSGFVLIGKDFMKAWLGDGFEDSYLVTLLLIIPATLPLTQNLGLAIVQAMNKYKFKAITTVVMAVLNVIISVFLAKTYGAAGAAFGTSIAIVYNIILMNIYYKRAIKLEVARFWKDIVLMLVKSTIPAAAMAVLIYVTGLQGWTAILSYGTFYVILYLVYVYCFILNRYEKSLLEAVRKKIFLRRRK